MTSFDEAKAAYEKLILLTLFRECKVSAGSKEMVNEIASTFGVLDNYFKAKKLCGKESVMYWRMSDV